MAEDQVEVCGLTFNLSDDIMEGELIKGGMLLLITVDENGEVGLILRNSGLNWLERGHALATAYHLENQGLTKRDED